MGDVIELSGLCPECGERMYVRVDPKARKIIKSTPNVLLHLVDFDSLGVEPDHHWCKSCAKPRDTFESVY